jgi:hypothetical protein
MMSPVGVSGSAVATVGGALWAAATCGLLSFLPAPPPLPLLLGVEVAAELEDRLAALGSQVGCCAEWGG